MDRADATGFGVAAAGHAALFALLSLGFAASKPMEVRQQPIEVAFVDEVGLESASPTPSAEEPAPLAGPPELPPAPAMAEPPPAPPAPAPAPTPTPVPQPQPQPKAPAPTQQRVQPKPAPPRPQAPAQPQQRAQAKPAPRPLPPAKPVTQRRNAGGLSSVVAGLSDRQTAAKATTPPAQKAGPQVEASLVAEVRRQVKPHWQRAVPTGADAESLRTELSLTLSRDGRVVGIDVVGTTGITASNRPQVALHQERAKRAVTLASPFQLPPQFYDAWRQLNVTLDLRLSQ